MGHVLQFCSFSRDTQNVNEAPRNVADYRDVEEHVCSSELVSVEYFSGEVNAMMGGAAMTMAQLRSAAKQKGMTLSPMKKAKGGAVKKK